MVEWRYTELPLSYKEGETLMNETVEAIFENRSPEVIWGLQHFPVYTAGTSAKSHDLLNPGGIPIYAVGRGGQYTYHGPGQLVVYCFLRLSRYQNDIHFFIHILESWIQKTLEKWNIDATRHLTGLWVKDKKLVSIGIRISRGISWHGFSINVTNDLKPFDGIIPCGLKGYGMTSLKEIGISATCFDVWEALKKNSQILF